METRWQPTFVSLQSLMGRILSIIHFSSLHCWELLRSFCTQLPTPSNICWTNNTPDNVGKLVLVHCGRSIRNINSSERFQSKNVERKGSHCTLTRCRQNLKLDYFTSFSRVPLKYELKCLPHFCRTIVYYLFFIVLWRCRCRSRSLRLFKNILERFSISGIIAIFWGDVSSTSLSLKALLSDESTVYKYQVHRILLESR